MMVQRHEKRTKIRFLYKARGGHKKRSRVRLRVGVTYRNRIKMESVG